MFRFDLSALSTRSYRTADRVPYKAFEESAKTPERKQRPKSSASSPARTARTQTSSTCSDNLNTTHNSIELDFLPSASSSRNKSSDAIEAWALDFTLPPKQDGFRSGTPSPPSSLSLVRRIPSSESFGKKSSTFSERGRRASLVGKTVLKNLRKTISLVNAESSDSGTSSKLKTKMRRKSLINAMSSDSGNSSKMIPKMRRNRSKSLPMIPREVMLNFVEDGEGVEITADSSKSDCHYNTSTNVDIQVPKIIRETSTYATKSLTSGEDSAEIYNEDDDIRKLCDLMKKIRNHSLKEASDMRFDFDDSIPSDSLGDSLSFSASGQEEDKEEACREPCQTTDCIDLMMFVNNEHKVLEYAPDEFHEFDSEFVSET